MADEPLGEAQALLLQQGLAAQPAVALKDGLAEAVGTLVAHLHRKRGEERVRVGASGSTAPTPQLACSLEQFFSEQHSRNATVLTSELTAHLH